MLSFALLLAVLPCVFTSNILVVVVMPSKSHVSLFEPVVRELAARGHKVTYMTPFGPKKPILNVNTIEIPVDLDEDKFKPFEMRHFGPFKNALILPFVGLNVCNDTMNTKEFKQFIQKKEKFDAVIVEAFLTESLAGGLSYALKAPLIGYGTFMPSNWVNFWIGNIAPTSFVPEPFTTLPTKMNFPQRVFSYVFQVVASVLHLGYFLSKQDQLMRHHFGSHLPPLKELIQNTSLLLVNDHISTSFPRPANPNLIGIAGLHVLPPKPLPQDLQKYLDNSKNGAIIFTLGSALKCSEMGEDRISILLDVFSKLKENVIWKFEKDLPKKPKNLMILDWLPQSDLLAHPNVKLFITHGGLLGTTEAIDRGVPIVGIPIFGDQPMNTEQSINAGVGLKVNFDALTREGVYDTIREVIDNPKYKEAALARSHQFKDRPQKPMDLAMYWIEYVIRHKGAHHLRSSAQDLSWFQENQYDVVLFLMAAIGAFLYGVQYMVKRIWRSLFGSKPTTVNKSKKKKN